ncbi:glycosyltransferase family 2 protein [Paracoccus sp. WLY502]|uniref:glycosyltransferase family 2 protein n=1 Tax=Paracoccus yibinensis TaxID=3068891 RepID=UPI00279643CE|nr:glycosyltransferase family 2 protein [Paracoccus sp. WLY502]MDQ1899581.1 glycosyltransferase family 2 protein [Paracoccus sp. WLY502]
MTPDVSVVLPAKNEAGNIAPLLRAIAAVLQDHAHEIIVVNDASTDRTPQELAGLQAELPQLRVICHNRSCGQSAAIRSGVLAARGALIATLDADGQNPPENLPALLAPFRQGIPMLGLVQGQRVGRRDRWTRRLASRLANRIRAGLLRDGVQDSGCGLKAFPREVYLALPFFDHIHRFMPAMIAREGLEVVTIPVTHAPRAFGRSNYGNLQRALVGIVDLLGAAWLIRRRRLTQAQELSRPAQDMRGAA